MRVSIMPGQDDANSGADADSNTHSISRKICQLKQKYYDQRSSPSLPKEGEGGSAGEGEWDTLAEVQPLGG